MTDQVSDCGVFDTQAEIPYPSDRKEISGFKTEIIRRCRERDEGKVDLIVGGQELREDVERVNSYIAYDRAK
jgi:hypothetical protein